MEKRSWGFLKLRLLTSVLIAMFFFSLFAMAGNGVPPDPEQMGPYAVGHSLYVFSDESRETTDYYTGQPVTIHHPVPVDVFYPVDPSTLSASTPKATYPLEAIHLSPDQITNSSMWEAVGLDPAYHEVAASTRGPFPLLMVSHGWHGPAFQMFYLGPRLASHGFVVAIVSHYGDAYWGFEEPDVEVSAIINRHQDVSVALTRLLEKNAAEGEILHNLIDPNKIAASGYSFGGQTAATLASGDDSACDTAMEAGLEVPPGTCIPLAADPRIRAIVTLDGINMFLKFYELARINVPTLIIGEEWHAIYDNMGLPNSLQARLHAASQGHPDYRVDITGADHTSFSGFCESLPVLLTLYGIPLEYLPYLQPYYCPAQLSYPEAKRIITKYMIAFLKTNLSREPGYQSILTPGYALTRENVVEFFPTEKRNPNAIDESWPDTFIYFIDQPGSTKAQADKDPVSVLPIPSTGAIRDLK